VIRLDVGLKDRGDRRSRSLGCLEVALDERDVWVYDGEG
jgi:hypothetical protein